jgi:plastocyanin
MLRLAFALAAASACDSGGTTTTADAPRDMGSTNKVLTVTCPTTADAMVTTTNLVDAYSPPTTMIPATGVVRFVMSSFHDVKPNTLTSTDPGLTVGFGETKCLRFTQAGTYGFFCSSHSFAGTIVVQ